MDQKSIEQANATVPSLDPNGRPMEQATITTETPKKKGKAGLIAGVIAVIVLFIGGAIALALMLANANKTDAVSAAVEKVITGNAPNYLATSGGLEIKYNDTKSLISKMTIGVDTKLDTRSLINNSKINLTLTMANKKSYTATLEEIYAADGDLYFKIEGVTALLEDSGVSTLMALGGAGGEAATMTNAEVMDGEWIRLSTGEITEALGDIVNSTIYICSVTMANDARENTNSLAETYKKYPFAKSANEKVAVEQKTNPIYRLEIDGEKLAAFLTDAQKNGIIGDLAGCFGQETPEVDANKVQEAVASWPPIYVEIDKNSNFTRIYSTTNSEDGNITYTTDLDLSYPTTINVTAPNEYKDFSQIIDEVGDSLTKQLESLTASITGDNSQ